eukprot:228063_1
MQQRIYFVHFKYNPNIGIQTFGDSYDFHQMLHESDVVLLMYFTKSNTYLSKDEKATNKRIKRSKHYHRNIMYRYNDQYEEKETDQNNDYQNRNNINPMYHKQSRGNKQLIELPNDSTVNNEPIDLTLCDDTDDSENESIINNKKQNIDKLIYLLNTRKRKYYNGNNETEIKRRKIIKRKKRRSKTEISRHKNKKHKHKSKKRRHKLKSKPHINTTSMNELLSNLSNNNNNNDILPFKLNLNFDPVAIR